MDSGGERGKIEVQWWQIQEKGLLLAHWVPWRTENGDALHTGWEGEVSRGKLAMQIQHTIYF